MISILKYQAACKEIPLQLQQRIELNIIKKVVNKNDCLVNLQCPNENSKTVKKLQWALVFSDIKSLSSFIEEVKSSNDTQRKLGIEDYSVFDNILFAFLKRQYILNQWVTNARNMLSNQPLAVFIFDKRLKQLVNLIESNTSICYKIDWSYDKNKPKQIYKQKLLKSSGGEALQTDRSIKQSVTEFMEFGQKDNTLSAVEGQSNLKYSSSGSQSSVISHIHPKPQNIDTSQESDHQDKNDNTQSPNKNIQEFFEEHREKFTSNQDEKKELKTQTKQICKSNTKAATSYNVENNIMAILVILLEPGRY